MKMKCLKCGTELTTDMFTSGMCFECGTPVEQSEKLFQEELEAEHKKIQTEKKELQLKLESDNKADFESRVNNHMLTTAYSFQGYDIKNHFGLVSGEVLLGGLVWKSVFSINELDKIEGTSYSDTIKRAKSSAKFQMINDSALLGGNAIIGISYSFEFLSNGMGIYISVNGTSVKISKSE